MTMRSAGPILTVVGVLMALWYLAVVPMNAPWERDQAARAGRELSLIHI